MNGLKAEPGWRRAWMARLNFCPAKLKPPTSARRAPVSYSMEMTVLWARGSCPSNQLTSGSGAGAASSASALPGVSTRRTRTMSPRSTSAEGARRVQALDSESRVTVVPSASTTSAVPSPLRSTTAGRRPDWAGIPRRRSAAIAASSSAPSSKLCSAPLQP